MHYNAEILFVNQLLLHDLYVEFFKYFFLSAPLSAYIFFLFNQRMNQDWVQELILAWIWHHFHLVLDERFEPTAFQSWVEFANH